MTPDIHGVSFNSKDRRSLNHIAGPCAIFFLDPSFECVIDVFLPILGLAWLWFGSAGVLLLPLALVLSTLMSLLRISRYFELEL